MTAIITVYGFYTVLKFRNDATEDRSFRSYRTQRLQSQERAAILFSSWLLGFWWRWGEDGVRVEDATDILYRRKRKTFRGRW